MKTNQWIRVLILAAVGAAGAACGDAPQSDEPTVNPAAQAAVAESVVYVDVRTQKEYDAGHVEDAIHIPHTEMEERYTELEQYDDRQIVVYCRSGRRSGIAQDILEDQGFDNVTNGGGLRDLTAQGVPTTRR